LFVAFRHVDSDWVDSEEQLKVEGNLFGIASNGLEKRYEHMVASKGGKNALQLFVIHANSHQVVEGVGGPKLKVPFHYCLRRRVGRAIDLIHQVMGPKTLDRIAQANHDSSSGELFGDGGRNLRIVHVARRGLTDDR
jgi:hypothetical protein